MTGSHYWLAQWLDENDIHSDWEIDHTLNNKSGVKGLMESVSRACHSTRDGDAKYPGPEVLSDSIVAGRQLDLSGKMSCPSYKCMRREIDCTFKQVWHYFDHIVVEGLAPQSLARYFRNYSEERFRYAMFKIRNQARLLLYLRDIGAERYVVFAPKSHEFCQEHWKEHARDLGLAAAIDESRHAKTIKDVMKSSEFRVKEDHSFGWHVTVTGKYFREPVEKVVFPPKEKTGQNPTDPEYIIRRVIDDYATAMISDVSLARLLALPLVKPVSLPWISRPHRDDGKAKADDAVIRVGLPVFDSLSTRDFLKLREDERPAFEIFRNELRRAIQSEIAQDPSNPPAAIARNIQSEYLRPGLASIEQRIRSRRTAVVKKTAVNLTIGTSAAAIGAITGMPLLVEGIAALGSAIPLAPIIHKFIDDGEPIKMDKFYFLWQAERRDGHH